MNRKEIKLLTDNGEIVNLNDGTLISCDDELCDWINDKAYEVIIDNLPFYLIEYADRINELIVGDFKDRDWTKLSNRLRGSSIQSLIFNMVDWYIEKHEDDLYQEYYEENRCENE